MPIGYRKWRPRTSPLFRLLGDHWEAFNREYEDIISQNHGEFRWRVGTVVGQFLECGIPDYGFVRIRCEYCHCELLQASGILPILYGQAGVHFCRMSCSRFWIIRTCWTEIRFGHARMLIHRLWNKGGRCRRCCERRTWAFFLKWLEVVRKVLAVVGYSRGGGGGAC